MKASKLFLSWIYLAFALIGGILPTMANINFMKEFGPGFNIQLFIEMANSNPASRSLSLDLVIGATTITIWMITESRRINMRHLWIVLLSTFTIAFAFAAPLFLCLRERRLLEIESN